MHPELIKDIENLNALSKEEKYDKIGFSESA
jgi:predicted solute-binding protein